MRLPAHRRRVVAALCVAALLAAVSPAATSWSLTRLGGGAPLDSESLATGVVIVVVWTTWSPRGGNIVERINRIESDWGSRARVVSVVFQEKPEAVERFLRDKKLAVPVYLDAGNAEFSKRHNVVQVPRLLLFRDGVNAVNVNLVDNADPLIRGALE